MKEYIGDFVDLFCGSDAIWFTDKSNFIYFFPFLNRNQVQLLLYSVGGEFTAIFTAVDEFLPPLYRGRVNIGIDGTWHLGGALASFLTMLVGETDHWRLMFLLGWVGIISLFLMRRNVPESPRWLMLNNRPRTATAIVNAIERAVGRGDLFLKEIEDDAEE